MLLPKFLQHFYPEAEKALKEGRVKDVEFSGPTYQVRVDDVWAFLQLDSKGKIKDCFCSCEGGEKCPHLAAAYLRIYDGHRSPLHHRFQRSLWNKLCELYAEHVGDDPTVIKEVGPDHYVCRSHGGHVIFYAKGDKALLNQICRERPIQTEETSLKFSNLSEGEIELWREGRPSLQLRYELSFWNDLAKELMMRESSGYTITFGYSPKKLPNQIHIQFSNLEVCFFISEANLPLIIPALATVDSPLNVYNSRQDSIQRITYDKANGHLLIEAKGIPQEVAAMQEREGIEIASWVFVPGDGFYPHDQKGLLESPRLAGTQISQALNEYYPVIKEQLEGVELHVDPVHVSHTLRFDDDWNLHIQAYVFKPGDLSKQDSRHFGDWAYLENEGFYPVEGMLFDEVEKVVPEERVAEFVREHRTWFNTFEEFKIHITSIETQLTYSVSENGHLKFSRVASLEEGKDFDQWIYIPGQGFFEKTTSSIGLPIASGTTIHPDQIPRFIRKYTDELHLIPGFFSEKCPIEKAGLEIRVTPENTVMLTPVYRRHPEYQNRPTHFFFPFIYTPGEGFHELTGEARLPELFSHQLEIHQENLFHFLTYELDVVREYAFSIDPRLNRPKNLQLVAETLEPEYKIRLRYVSEKGSVKLSQIFQSADRYLFTDAGLIDLKEERYHWFKRIAKKQLDRRSNILTLSTMELLQLTAYDPFVVEKGEEHLEELLAFKIRSEPDFTGMKGELRPYQEMGVRWLWFLFQHKLSGLLCDDMGLGKTHQAMALLVAVTNGKFLIICPTSVIYHWQEKIEAYLPNLRVCTYHGTQRQLDEDFDVLLTSYGIWRREHETLEKISFDVAVFDEIQAAKNQASRLYASLKKVNAKMRVGLTGTPIENRLRELKALFDLVLPNFMPPETDYKEFFIKPIERENDPVRKQLLSRFIKPFILRRKKGDVLYDLPEKTEEIAHCDLSSDQADLYNQVLEKMRTSIIQELQDGTTPVPYIHIFAVLSALKQICNHPAAYLKSPSAYKNYFSGKWDLFLELLSEARESGQKVVVFSQYLAMLDIIEEYLKEHEISFASIRGATIDRGKQVAKFNRDPDCEVFLGSLQAAGWGIDLTAASVVIHYDRWWNAAREDQATDRVHRIGQTRGVQVFKLVTKGTFEERIDTLITQKGKLMEEVVGVDDHQFVKKFSRDEILQLLQDVQ